MRYRVTWRDYQKCYTFIEAESEDAAIEKFEEGGSFDVFQQGDPQLDDFHPIKATLEIS